MLHHEATSQYESFFYHYYIIIIDYCIVLYSNIYIALPTAQSLTEALIIINVINIIIIINYYCYSIATLHGRVESTQKVLSRWYGSILFPSNSQDLF